jgi:hypothetical protein
VISLLDIINEEGNAAHQADMLGLDYMQFGRYGKNGKVTHNTDNDRLVPVRNTDSPPKDIGTIPKRRAKRPNPRTARQKSNPISKDFEKSAKQMRDATVPVQSKPTKEDPSFDELHSAAKQHKFTVMSEKKLAGVRNVPDQLDGPEWKPKGFWFASDSEWVDWVENEAPHWKGDNLYTVEVDESKCLVLNDIDDLYRFSNKYGVQGSVGTMINWNKVANDYSGVIIPNYIHEARMNSRTDWYYTWDVGSGCVWDNSAIKNVEQLSIK